jgi:hypothetical protein
VQRKLVSLDGWSLLRDAHVSAIHTNEAVIPTATIFNLKGRIGARIGLDNLSEEHFFCWMLILSFTTAF